MADIVALGSALLDIEYHSDPQTLADTGLPPGDTVMVGAEQQERCRNLLDRQLSPPTMHAGGSVANSLSVAALAGHRCSLLSMIGTDAAGEHYIRSMRQKGVEVLNLNAQPNSQTGNCLALITSGGERTMSTFLGVSADLEPSLVRPQPIAAADWLLLEAYILASDEGFAALMAAREAAAAASTKVAFTLSSAALVQARRPQLMQVLDSGVEVVFCNEQEALAASGQADSELALDWLLQRADEVAVTLSERGAVVGRAAERWQIAAESVEVRSALGAGDAFAGAYLAAAARGLPPEKAGQWGCKAGTAQTQAEGPQLAEAGAAELAAFFRQ